MINFISVPHIEGERGKDMIEVKHLYSDIQENLVLAYLVNKGRGCWYGCDFDIIEGCDGELDTCKKVILDTAIQNGFDPASLPHIEDTDPLLKELYDNVSQSESSMWFVEPGDIDKEIISQEEYEQRIDDVIKKYHLEDVITKNSDGCLYSCYAELQWRFSEAETNMPSDAQ